MDAAAGTGNAAPQEGYAPDYRRIVLAYDGSEGAQLALDRAARVAMRGAALTILHVALPLYRHTINALADPSAIAEGERLLGEARRRLAERGISAETAVRVGEAGDELVAAARELGADLLVVGAGKGTLERLVLGSVSTHAVHHAPCDVLVARSSRREREEPPQ
ncbi:MAG: universal stress protein [Thermoleophilia bacterium]|nr:universal stress protein [Thermoleophilia bacterium]